MNPISTFLIENLDAVYFLYGLAFFSLGLALALASRRASQFRFAQAIRPLAAFGILHGLHEWVEMFQLIGVQTTGQPPSPLQNLFRLALLVISFLMLLAFGLSLLAPKRVRGWRLTAILLAMTAIWALGSLAAIALLDPSLRAAIIVADVLARYSLAIPAALLAAWAMMVQQHTFREYGMPQFGRDLVWAAAALLLYGVVGQMFVPQSLLFPSTALNSGSFLQWFGIPVQLFREVMAAALAVVMVRVLNAFEWESQRQLEEANEASLAAQAQMLEAERRTRIEREQLNNELRQTARELALLLELSNLLAVAMGLQERLLSVLQRLVRSLDYPSAGMILLMERQSRTVAVEAEYCLIDDDCRAWMTQARGLGEQCAAGGMIVCLHEDGAILQTPFDEALRDPKCRLYHSPTTIIALPLRAGQEVIGAIVLARGDVQRERPISVEELQLMMAVARQLGLSIENARLHQDAREREQRLGELLRQVVHAQESERQRIARELHDATGQALTAIGLGLRGVEGMLERDQTDRLLLIGQVQELKSFSTQALGELRQLIADLRPAILDDMGLAAALRWYCQAFEARRAIDTDFILEGPATRLPSDYETVLFRIAQEALTNVAKHARAGRVTVVLRFELPQICLIVEDDGVGFDAAAIWRDDQIISGWGLMGIQERTILLGGRYAIDSEPGRGARVWVSVPLALPMEGNHAEDQTTAG